MASESKALNSADNGNGNGNGNDNYGDDNAGILWERSGSVAPGLTMGLPERRPGVLRTVGITMVLCFLLAATGHHYNSRDERHFEAMALNSNSKSNTNSDANANANANSQSDNDIGSGSGLSLEENSNGIVVVTGATGRLGSLLYKELVRNGATVRAFVRDADKARSVLGCHRCDETEGIYVGDVTRPSDLKRAFEAPANGISEAKGLVVTTLAVAVGAEPYDSPEVQKAVEFDSVVASVRALGMAANANANVNVNAKDLRVVFCSSMGTNRHSKWAGDIPFWKLNAEAFLATSGIATTIVKPCGLSAAMGVKNSTLLVGHHGTIMEHSVYHGISREDVASVMTEAVAASRQSCYEKTQNLRFDLCSRPGPPTTDLKALLESARWEWDRPQ